MERFDAAEDRDCHGYEKPTGKCPGLAWGTGTGWVYLTLTIPVPAEGVGGLAQGLKLHLEMRSTAVLSTSIATHQHPMASKM